LRKGLDLIRSRHLKGNHEKAENITIYDGEHGSGGWYGKSEDHSDLAN
jgi:hypothetical protein